MRFNYVLISSESWTTSALCGGGGGGALAEKRISSTLPPPPGRRPSTSTRDGGLTSGRPREPRRRVPLRRFRLKMDDVCHCRFPPLCSLCCGAGLGRTGAAWVGIPGRRGGGHGPFTAPPTAAGHARATSAARRPAAEVLQPATRKREIESGSGVQARLNAALQQL